MHGLQLNTVKPHNILTDNAMIYMSLNTPDHGPLFAVIQWRMHMYNPVFQLENSA